MKAMKVKIKHVDGVTDVMARAFISSDGISLDYRFEGMSYGVELTFLQAVQLGIIECDHQNVEPILGFENSQIGERCTTCNKEMMFRDIYKKPLHNKTFKTD